MQKKLFKKTFLNKSYGSIKIIISISIIIFITNLSALIDLIFHPDIPYFDWEHILVGSITFLLCLLFLFIMNLNFKYITKKNKLQKKLIKKLEKEKVKSIENEDKLKELNFTKDKIFSIIAHDLRSPFNGILGFSELLVENIKELTVEESEKYMRIINSSAKNTLVLLDNLLNWAKFQTGQINFNPENIFLSPLFKELIETSHSIAKIKNITINYNQSDEIKIYADKILLMIVLRNLISNAIKFTNLNGTINIFVISNTNQVEISISDNGIGIKEEALQNLFNITKNETTRGTANEKGSGLGLILCRDFIEMHGGKIWAKSEEGKGSEFKLTLPGKKSLPINKSNLNKSSFLSINLN